MEEDTKTPLVIREVGQSPEQYPEPDWDGEEWEENGGPEDKDIFPAIVPHRM